MDAIQTWPQAAVAIAPMICLAFVVWCFFRAL
jgi:hypothetical protein